MSDARFQLITPADRTDYRDLISPLSRLCWPEFILHDPIAGRYWKDLFDRFAEYQFCLVDTQTGQAIASGHSVPLHWGGDPADLPEHGWDWALEQAVSDHRDGLLPRTQCAIAISVHPDYRSRGLSTRMVQAMSAIGQRKGFAQLIAPVRPNQKHQYPLAPIDRYITWQTAAGLPFDAWLRVHVRLGAMIVKPCHESMTISGSLAEWTRWSGGMQFPESGLYIVPGALTPVEISVEVDRGVYIEQNVWTIHMLDGRCCGATGEGIGG